MTAIANTPQDRELIANLTSPAAVGPGKIDAAESAVVRVAIAMAGPLWLAALGAACMLRLVRGRVPLIVLHERVGYGRCRLWVPKIGTASVPGNRRRALGLIEVATGPPVELEVDGRFEQWLRQSGIDELPQLALIVAGTMRLVGPRPVTPSELAEMISAGQRAGVDQLHPGVVGLWQVLDRHAYELPERQELDELMIDNWSVRLQVHVVMVALRQAVGRLILR